MPLVEYQRLQHLVWNFVQQLFMLTSKLPFPKQWQQFLIIEPTRCTNSQNVLYWNETLHVSDSSSVHHQEFPTAHTAVVYVTQVCWQFASRSICSYSQAVSKPVRHIPLLCVQWKTPDDGQRNCPKHVEFHSKIKILRICASSWFYYKEFITMHGHMNVNQ